ncbi:UDP-glucose 4-epimerase GalE [Sphingomonas ginkgonis]|uniref:UDP-glucose 4-epimerase n=1 Tax=Sphingomonas ginkgonis TaxID=2315330 RepID=A0A3R9WQN9_9SPHN|nr:UDP-glucose 4-epimerase GalE [Sphingomonas ginkgonis]RST29469.1 UDP-glucose 4-epimerase GalE [Sphingomonas ginkgonis]
MPSTKPLVLVTGGAGYIGSHAVLALRDSGYPVIVLDDLSNGTREAIPADVELVVGDVGDRSVTDPLLRDKGVGAIMHFAGSIVVPESVTDPIKYYSNNSAASLSLIRSAIEAGVPHLVFSSTAAVYGAAERVPIVESDPLLPINPYGASKLMTERMLADIAPATPGFSYAALRYFNVAGADPQGRSGQRGKGATHLLKVACEAAVGKRDKVQVFGTDYPTPDGTCIRDYIHVADLADAHVAVLEALLADPATSRIHNCGYGKGFSVLEMLDALDRVNGTPVPREMGPRRAGDPPQLVADSSGLQSQTSWRPKRNDVEQIIADALRWEKKLLEESQA